jgi:ribosomal protein S27AE
MKESLKCVPISKRDYDVANALHIKAYGEALPIVSDNRLYVNMHHDECPRCKSFDVHDDDSYCKKCGAELLERKAVKL